MKTERANSGAQHRASTKGRVSCIGAGVIGRSWAVCFANAGFEVALYDASPQALQGSLAEIERMAWQLQGAGRCADANALQARITAEASLKDALRNAFYVQESVGENAQHKHTLLTQVGELAEDTTIIASSTSSLDPDELFASVALSERCIVVHPVNPPHLIPLVELCPSSWTSASTLAASRRLMETVGQRPIQIRRFIPGYVLNRLQMAVLSEAMYLVGENFCGADDIDQAIKFGLGMRWAFMGPFETAHLNAPNGFAEYMQKFGPAIQSLIATLQTHYQWSPAMIHEIHADLTVRQLAASIAECQRWRDQRLLDLARQLGN